MFADKKRDAVAGAAAGQTSTDGPVLDANAVDTGSAELAEKHLSLIDRALALQAPIANRYIDSLRAKKSTLSDDELVALIEKRFMTLATAAGAGIGGAAALPGIGTAAAIGMTAGEGVAFAEAVAFLTLAVARVRGVDMKDPARRKIVTYGILGGERGADIVSKSLGKQGVQWAGVLNGAVPDVVMNAVNKRVKKWIQRTLARRLGTVWAGRLIPFGIGAAVGGAGNFAVARSVIEAEREIFASARTVAGSPNEPDAIEP